MQDSLKRTMCDCSSSASDFYKIVFLSRAWKSAGCSCDKLFFEHVKLLDLRIQLSASFFFFFFFQMFPHIDSELFMKIFSHNFFITIL